MFRMTKTALINAQLLPLGFCAHAGRAAGFARMLLGSRVRTTTLLGCSASCWAAMFILTHK